MKLSDYDVLGLATPDPMATLKFVDSVTSFHVNIKLRYKLNWDLAILISQLNFPAISPKFKLIKLITYGTNAGPCIMGLGIVTLGNS